MTTRLKVSQLRKLIVEETKKVLNEVGEKEKKEKGEDSLDAQVDKYLLDFESDSKSVKKEGRDFRVMVRNFLLEADEDKKDKKDEDKKLTAEDIDVENFVDGVIRLIDNYDSLLEIQNTILRRAVNFLVEGYEPDVAEAFKDDISDRHGIEIGKTKSEVEDDQYRTPTADRAGPGLGA